MKAHQQSHLLRRKPKGDDEKEEKIETVVVTMPNTFKGPVVWVTQTAQPTIKVGAPVQQSQPKTTDKPKPTTAPSATKAAATTQTRDKESLTRTDERESAATTLSMHTTASTLRFEASSKPSTSASISITSASTSLGGIVAATAATVSPSAESTAAASNTMSSGTKAGVALGVLVGIAVLLGAILFFYHRKKKQAAARNQLDNEKPLMMVEPAPSVRSARTMSTAPRLSLRPLTQFSPTFPNRKSTGNMLDMAATQPVAASDDSSRSAWERPGAANAATSPVNPFNDPQSRSASPPQDPFRNNAAIESQEAPVSMLPSAENNVSVSSVEMAASAPAVAPLPAPPSIKPESDSVSRNSAWSEDIPASPGPAPSGPLPIAVSGGPSDGPGASPNNVHRVQLDFQPSMSDELELHAGQLVRLLHEYDDGWTLCLRMDRSQQGVVPRACLSKHPVKFRNGPPRQPPLGSRMRGPPVIPAGSAVPQPRPTSHGSPHPPSLSPANGRMSPAPRHNSPGYSQMSSPHGAGRARSNSNAPHAGPPRSMSPGPYGGGPQVAPPPQMGRRRSNSAGQPVVRRGSPPSLSPMNPNANLPDGRTKPLPGQAL